MGMTLSIKSLDAETVLNTEGVAFPVGECSQQASLQINGIVGGDKVTIQFSNDGDNWEDGTEYDSDQIVDIDKHYKYARAKLTAVAGGGSVTALFSGYNG